MSKSILNNILTYALIAAISALVIVTVFGSFYYGYHFANISLHWLFPTLPSPIFSWARMAGIMAAIMGTLFLPASYRDKAVTLTKVEWIKSLILTIILVATAATINVLFFKTLQTFLPTMLAALRHAEAFMDSTLLGIIIITANKRDLLIRKHFPSNPS